MFRSLAAAAIALAALPAAAQPPDPAAPPELSCSASGPICRGYGACEPYRVADARCVCRCMGDDEWSEQVRCCLWDARQREQDPDRAHAACWGAATADTGMVPAGKLAVCISACALKTDACTGGEPPCPDCCRDLPEDLPSLMALVDCTADLKLKHCAMGRLRERHGVAGLREALAAGNACLRAEAAHALWVYPPSEVQEVLLEAAGDRDPHVRMWAAFSLGEVGDEAVLPALRRLARERRPFVAAMAREAIVKVRTRLTPLKPDGAR
jgi:hypothetical protein